MKIDVTQTHDLLERMREAARAAELDTSTGVSGTQHDVDVAATGSTLEDSLRATAERALRGEFESAAALRGEVVEQILRERWASRLTPAKVDEMVEQLSSTLVDDPEFSRQVDEMLVLAARHVSTR